MRIVRTVREITRLADAWHRRNRTIGLVPTMGALHEGHLSLIRQAAKEHGVVLVTIFVNPLQFGPREDVAGYPRTLRRDVHLARASGADVVFAPPVAEIYPPGFQTAVEVGPLSARWEGQHRPGHLRGVSTVVARLFLLTRPTAAYFGQKDYQQALIIRRMIRDLHLPIRFRLMPTVREPDGLAMSSRNVYLSAKERRRAAGLIHALRLGRERIRHGECRAAPVARAMRHLLIERGKARVDYVAVADGETLEPLPRLRGRVALLVAARIGRTRLIDNLLVVVP